jgi:signal transduction histidine kinase
MRRPPSEVRTALARTRALPVALGATLAALVLGLARQQATGGTGGDRVLTALAAAVVLGLVLALALSLGALRAVRRAAADFEAALVARDDFIAVAAHELKNPLTAFRLNVDTLARLLARPGPEPSPDRVQRGVRAMQQTAARFVELVNRLLDVSRLSGGRLRLEIDELDLADVVKECVARLGPDLEQARCPIELRAVPSVGRWDRLRVESVVTNLLGNALKYGRGRPIAITLEDATSHVRLAVLDQGIGIAPEDQRRIFGRFQRAVPPGSYEGLGIGLWLTRAIVEAHGGTIAVDSRPGEGATFVVELPKRAPERGDGPGRRGNGSSRGVPLDPARRRTGARPASPRAPRWPEPTARSAPPRRADPRA